MLRMILRPGHPYPLGATWNGLGVNFALSSPPRRTRRTPPLWSPPTTRKKRPASPYRSAPAPVWHGFLTRCDDQVSSTATGVHGPYDPENGHRFNPHKVLLDPYAKALGRSLEWDDALFGYQVGGENEDLTTSETDSAPYAPLGMVRRGRLRLGRPPPPQCPLGRHHLLRKRTSRG